MRSLAVVNSAGVCVRERDRMQRPGASLCENASQAQAEVSSSVPTVSSPAVTRGKQERQPAQPSWFSLCAGLLGRSSASHTL